jgi:uridine kinase
VAVAVTVSVPASPSEVIERVRALTQKKDSVLVAIAGRGGAGKSTLAHKIRESIPSVTVVCLDDFARPSTPGWNWERFQHQVLEPFVHRRPGRYQRWDWPTDSPAEWHDVPVIGVLVVEGVSPLRSELGHPWDVTVWVEAPYELRLKRGVERDGEEMRSTWTERWMPEEDAYVEREHPDQRADFVVDGSQNWDG